MFATLAILYLILRYFYKRFFPQKHAFWDKQPVSRNYSQGGLLTNKRLPEVPMPQLVSHNIDISNLEQRLRVTEFLNNHFIRGYQYTPEFISWAFSNQNHDNLSFLDPRDRRLVGTIAGKSIDLVVSGQREAMSYIDYLAVHRKYRSRRIATGLISRMTANNPHTKFIFKIESQPLPFDHVCRFRYYSYHLKGSIAQQELPRQESMEPHPLHPLTEKDLPDAYRYYTEQSHAFSLSAQYTQETFRRWFYPRKDIVYTFVRRDGNGQITCLASFFMCNFVMTSFWGSSSKPIPMGELMFLVGDNKVSDAKLLLKEAQRLGCEYFVCPNTGKNTVFIDRLTFYAGKQCYLQFYNYGTTREFHPSEVLFNPP
jgi:hypothetical protein